MSKINNTVSPKKTTAKQKITAAPIAETTAMAPELAYLQALINYQLGTYFKKEGTPSKPPAVPARATWQIVRPEAMQQNKWTDEELTLLLIALVPHILPEFYDTAIQQFLPQAGEFPQLGGVRGKQFRGFLPTGETALFLLAGTNWKKRLEVQELFEPDHEFALKRILWLEDVQAGEPLMSARIMMDIDYVNLFIKGKPGRPHFSMSFPARLIATELTWNDLVLDESIMVQIRELETWLHHNDQLMNEWGMKHKLKKGYRALFYGPPGTGKTFTASLLGKYTGRDVYKIDLSMVVSKYIGETEKNLETLFAKAADKGWIIFFDEADALFGKRTSVRDAHDKYANQEVSYLLQRIEDFNGLVILATNMKNNIDDAFIRRFNAIIQFQVPGERERAAIWQKTFPPNVRFLDEEDIPGKVKKYEITGGNIINVVQYACLKALERKSALVSLDDVVNGIRKEMNKEGRSFII
ncbi:ATPase family associated with various cellular activities (AAA) [Chitinophaga ginsengisegetis]|uniref:ATPase family associated with various cellular activities (AAA) n=1 Tax=Chitinophaga ginsengisegetis TaxID=393003 RepID=A0A1T5P9T5_9BACT|nr:ATP-binding protein [Chitinophaga ginsengisegetis]SKD09009.1 ATPase family associated with various cellular activities (AAA) [Chitinophaga ginsengisegetis]